MIEGLFVITTIFVSYVVYQIVNEPKTTSISDEPQAVTEIPSASEQPAAPVEAPAPEAVATVDIAAVSDVPAAEPADAVVEEAPVAEDVSVADAAATTEAVADVDAVATTENSPSPKAVGIKNPATGEVVIAYTNYRFAKRWIKEALVTEGLLKKIYKNNELNAAVEAKIKVAIATLEAMDKYRV